MATPGPLKSILKKEIKPILESGGHTTFSLVKTIHKIESRPEHRKRINLESKHIPCEDVIAFCESRLLFLQDEANLKYGIYDPNCKGDDGTTPLIVASENGVDNAVIQLLNKGAEINLSDKDGRTPLFIAAQNRRYGVLRLLLKKGANVNQTNRFGGTPLIVASEMGYSRIARLLLDNGANVNQATYAGITPLMFASGNGHLKVVQELIAKEADLNRSVDGWTALGYAKSNQHEDVVNALRKAGAKDDVPGEEDMSSESPSSNGGKRTTTKKRKKPLKRVNRKNKTRRKK